MIVLDTNVVSEAMSRQPNPAVTAWLDRQTKTQLWISTITLAELRHGIERLGPSRRRRELDAGLAVLIEALFANRVLAFDADAAVVWGAMKATREALGRPGEAFDIAIAAIARVHDAAVATRDTAGFDHLGLRLINPFAEG